MKCCGLSQRIAVARPAHAPLQVDGGKVDYVLFKGGLCVFRLAPLSHRASNGLVALTAAGRYFSISEADAASYDDCHVVVWGSTVGDFLTYGREVAAALINKGFPAQELQMELLIAIIGLPRDPQLLHYLQQGLCNALTGAKLRLPGPVALPGEQTVEYAVIKQTVNELFKIYCNFAEKLDAARVAAVAKLRRLTEERAGEIKRRVKEFNSGKQLERARLASRQRHELQTLGRKTTDSGAALQSQQQQQRATHEHTKNQLQLRHEQAYPRFAKELAQLVPMPDARVVLWRNLILAALTPEQATRALDVLGLTDES